jgi:hypothetical protein
MGPMGQQGFPGPPGPQGGTGPQGPKGDPGGLDRAKVYTVGSSQTWTAPNPRMQVDLYCNGNNDVAFAGGVYYAIDTANQNVGEYACYPLLAGYLLKTGWRCEFQGLLYKGSIQWEMWLACATP